MQSNSFNYQFDPNGVDIFKDECEVHPNNLPFNIWVANYALGPFDNTANNYILIMELPITTKLFGVYMKNVQNGAFNNVGTEDFRIETSTDGSAYTQVVSSTMQDIRNVPCSSIPLEHFPFSPGK